MSTKRPGPITNIQREFGPGMLPKSGDPAASLTALAVTVALLRALRDRGLLSEGEIDDLFGDAAELLQGTSALNLLDRVRFWAEHKDKE